MDEKGRSGTGGSPPEVLLLAPLSAKRVRRKRRPLLPVPSGQIPLGARGGFPSGVAQVNAHSCGETDRQKSPSPLPPPSPSFHGPGQDFGGVWRGRCRVSLKLSAGPGRGWGEGEFGACPVFSLPQLRCEAAGPAGPAGGGPARPRGRCRSCSPGAPSRVRSLPSAFPWPSRCEVSVLTLLNRKGTEAVLCLQHPRGAGRCPGSSGSPACAFAPDFVSPRTGSSGCMCDTSGFLLLHVARLNTSPLLEQAEAWLLRFPG